MIEIDVVVVGGGFSGCAVAANLARHADAISSLALFEPDELGRGAAYGTPHREHLLNTRASQMSLYSDEPGHFVSWLGSRGGPDDFLPRQLYGEYVGDVAEENRAVRAWVVFMVAERIELVERRFHRRVVDRRVFRRAPRGAGNGTSTSGRRFSSARCHHSPRVRGRPVAFRLPRSKR